VRYFESSVVMNKRSASMDAREMIVLEDPGRFQAGPNLHPLLASYARHLLTEIT
jgi:hypothetical protein